MYHVIVRKNNRDQRKVRIRKKIIGSSDIPRLSVFRSNRYDSAQIIDDKKGITVVSASTITLTSKGKTKTEKAFEIGKDLAKKALALKIKGVVFDRSGYRYHGRVKAIAEGAREGGLKL
jgi:large subunit ribosomal protein L18